MTFPNAISKHELKVWHLIRQFLDGDIDCDEYAFSLDRVQWECGNPLLFKVILHQVRERLEANMKCRQEKDDA